MGRIDFKDGCINLVLNDKTHSFEYSRGLLQALEKRNIKLPFSLWILILNRI